MSPLDRWSAAARDKGVALWPEAASQRLEMRLATEAAPLAQSRRREIRRFAACVGAAALCGFATTGVIEWRTQPSQAPRWPAAALDASPSVLLVADRGR
jgi:hypothetical protein